MPDGRYVQFSTVASRTTAWVPELQVKSTKACMYACVYICLYVCLYMYVCMRFIHVCALLHIYVCAEGFVFDTCSQIQSLLTTSIH